MDKLSYLNRMSGALSADAAYVARRLAMLEEKAARANKPFILPRHITDRIYDICMFSEDLSFKLGVAHDYSATIPETFSWLKHTSEAMRWGFDSPELRLPDCMSQTPHTVLRERIDSVFRLVEAVSEVARS